MSSLIKAFMAAFVVSVVGFSNSALAQNRGCDPQRDPHSFACQADTFFGRIFPMVPANQNRVVGNWKTLVYTAAPGQAPIFRSSVSPENPRIPTGLLNPDRSLVGRFAWPADGVILFHGFGAADNTLVQMTSVRVQGNSIQLVLKNNGAGVNEGLSCRVFLRNRTEHMLCQWQRDDGRGFVFMGYLGFIR